MTSTNTTITQLRARVAELETELAHERLCPLTSLPTRRYFSRLAAAAYSKAGAVLLGDIDGLKTVNDHHGHHAGDTLIAEVAQRLHTALGTNATLGRLGGDEFTALLPINPRPRDLDRMYQRVVAPFPLINGIKTTPGISLGVIIGEQLARRSLSEALQGADLAMYAAKKAGTGWCHYDPAEHGPITVEAHPRQRTRQYGHVA